MRYFEVVKKEYPTHIDVFLRSIQETKVKPDPVTQMEDGVLTKIKWFDSKDAACNFIETAGGMVWDISHAFYARRIEKIDMPYSQSNIR